MAKIKTKYVCQSCGYETTKWLGKCPECTKWNTFVEEIEEKKSQKEVFIINKGDSKPISINSIEIKHEERFSTQIEELDRVLGGGIVKGSLVLVGGDPGIGKSTLLMQVSRNVACSGKKVLYISGEESQSQIKMRAHRLGVNTDNLLIFSENNLSIIEAYLDNINPDLIIVDSIQTVYSPEISSAPGTVSQIKEGTSRFMKISKRMGISTFIVGHVTKEGSLAGPKLLEHMVDTVLYFEGERYNTYRLVRAVKNRFGSTNEIGIFEMKNGGLSEVANPSEIFLEERLKGATGSAVVASLEGTRPILVELQALVTPTAFGNAKRTTTGLDHNRVALLMAVLEKRAGLLLQNQDAYLKAAGGVKLDEPAIDLAIAVSLVSSYRDAETRPTDCFIGEVGLTGEIRRVNRIEQRVVEAAKLGFKRVFLPKNNLDGWMPPKEIEVVGVSTLNQALKLIFS